VFSAAPIAAADAVGLRSPVWAVLAPRLWLLLLSLAGDAALARFCRRTGIDVRPVLLAGMATWSGALLTTRPFSNTVEALWLVLLLWLVGEAVALSSRRVGPGKPPPWAVHAVQAGAGVVLALGIFTRFTFVLFAAAPGVAMVVLAASRGAWRAPAPEAPGGGASGPRGRRSPVPGTTERPPGRGDPPGCDACGAAASLAVAAAEALGGFGLAAWALIRLDTRWFGATETVVAPLTNLLYNLDSDNLALHGTHPRWLHGAVNGPLLFGPLWPVALLLAPGALAALGAAPGPREAGRAVAAGVLVVGLLGLSLAPHQEPRFLLPLLAPLAVLAGPAVWGRPGEAEAARGAWRAPAAARWASWAWLVLGLVWYGCLHEGGTVRAVLGVRDAVGAGGGAAAGGALYAPAALAGASADVPVVGLLTAGTFMVPRALLGMRAAAPPSGAASHLEPRGCSGLVTGPQDRQAPAECGFRVFEGRGAEQRAAGALREACAAPGGSAVVLLSSGPATAAAVAGMGPGVRAVALASYSPHVSMEAPPSSIGDLRLDSTLLVCDGPASA